jgi:hypothetical protein
MAWRSVSRTSDSRRIFRTWPGCQFLRRFASLMLSSGFPAAGLALRSHWPCSCCGRVAPLLLDSGPRHGTVLIFWAAALIHRAGPWSLRRPASFWLLPPAPPHLHAEAEPPSGRAFCGLAGSGRALAAPSLAAPPLPRLLWPRPPLLRPVVGPRLPRPRGCLRSFPPRSFPPRSFPPRSFPPRSFPPRSFPPRSFSP